MGDWPVRSIPGGVTVVSPVGRLNQTSAPALREQLHALLRDGHIRLVVDMTNVDAIDSVGLGALVSALKAARHAGGDVRIAAPQFRVSTVLELAQLDRVLMSFESPEQAFDDPT